MAGIRRRLLWICTRLPSSCLYRSGLRRARLPSAGLYRRALRASRLPNGTDSGPSSPVQCGSSDADVSARSHYNLRNSELRLRPPRPAMPVATPAAYTPAPTVAWTPQPSQTAAPTYYWAAPPSPTAYYANVR